MPSRHRRRLTKRPTRWEPNEGTPVATLTNCIDCTSRTANGLQCCLQAPSSRCGSLPFLHKAQLSLLPSVMALLPRAPISALFSSVRDRRDRAVDRQPAGCGRNRRPNSEPALPPPIFIIFACWSSPSSEAALLLSRRDGLGTAL